MPIVLTGGGSAQVYPPGGNAVPGLSPEHWPGPVVYAPSSPGTRLVPETHLAPPPVPPSVGSEGEIRLTYAQLTELIDEAVAEIARRTGSRGPSAVLK
jgi:hypothetical protein